MDTYGRLPSDVLKYISFLGAMPQIDTVDNILVIETPFMTYTISLYSPYDCGRNPIHISKEIEAFETTNCLDMYMGCDDEGDDLILHIFIYEKTIEIKNNYEVNNSITLPIIMLDKLKAALKKYANYLKDYKK
jgi:hypothetical protein